MTSNKDMPQPIEGGIRVMKNELLPPNEIMLVVGADAYESIKKNNKAKALLAQLEEKEDGNSEELPESNLVEG